MHLLKRSVVMAALAGMVACGPSDPLQAQAEEYVRLALALDQYRQGEVDAYFGPAELDVRGTAAQPQSEPDLVLQELQELQSQAQALLSAVAADAENSASPRSQHLQAKLRHYVTLLGVLAAPKPPSFADETRTLYGIELPVDEEGAAQRILDALDELLPGQGTLAFRVASFRNQLIVPADKRKAVFERALEECRLRTLAHWQLPASEQLTVEWTRDVQAAWHRYEGGYHSRLQVNDLTLAFIGSAIDVACHEGYPGHHAQFVLLESALLEPVQPGSVPLESAAGEPSLPVEETVVLLRSPASVLREGAANYGVDLVFPPAERLVFERDVLFPLAGLSPAQAEKHAAVHRLLGELADAVIPIVRDYRDGVHTFNAATFLLDREALVSSPSELLQFVDRFGAYSVGYTVARSLLRDYVETAGRETGEDGWAILREVLVQPDKTVAVFSEPGLPD